MENENEVLRKLRTLALQNNREAIHEQSPQPKLIEDVLLNALRRTNPSKYSSFTLQNGDVRWKFVEESVSILSDLHHFLLEHSSKQTQSTEPPIDSEDSLLLPPLLSLNDKNCVVILLQIIVAWGIYPSLLSAVGIPLNSRLEKTSFDVSTIRKGNRDELLLSAKTILSFSKIDDFSGIISAKHTVDLISAFTQLIYSPPPNGNINDSESIESLHFLISQMHIDHIIESLLSLISLKPPNWMASICGKLLSQSILRNGGVYVLSENLLCSLGSSEISVQRIAKQISTTPSFIKREEYFASIIPQISKILRQPIGKTNESIFHISILCIKNMIEMDPILVKTYLLDPILLPFKVYLGTTSQICSETSFQEKEIESTLIILARLLISEDITAELITPLILPDIQSLFELMVFTSKGISSIKNIINDILISLLFHSQNLTNTLLSLIMQTNTRDRQYSFANGQQGGVLIIKSNKTILTDEENDENDENTALCIIKLLSEIDKKNPKIAGDIFITLLKLLAFAEEEEGEEEETNNELNGIGLRVLSLLTDTFSLKLIQDIVQLCHFLQLILSRNDESSVSVAITIIIAILSQEMHTNSEQFFLFTEMIPRLETLRLVSNASPELQTIVNRALSLIKTSLNKNKQPATEQQKPTASSMLFHQIEIELSDPIISTRAGALIKLRKIVSSRDPIVLSNLPHILDLLVSQLSQEEEFVFGSAVSGLACLGDLYPEQILPRLASSFTDKALKEQTRAKIGESLLQVLIMQGDAIPRWFDRTIENSILGSLRDTNSSLIRASAIAILATVLDILPKANVEMLSSELILAMKSIIQTDNDVQVRRGASIVIGSVCKALTITAEYAISHSKQLSFIISLLRSVSHSDQDEIVSQNCLGILDSISEIIPLSITEQLI